MKEEKMNKFGMICGFISSALFFIASIVKGELLYFACSVVWFISGWRNYKTIQANKNGEK